MLSTKLFELISKEYVGSPEIKEIINLSGGKCGINKAQKIRKNIADECTGYLLPAYMIPTEKLLKKLGINIDRVHKKAKMERELRDYHEKKN